MMCKCNAFYMVEMVHASCVRTAYFPLTGLGTVMKKLVSLLVSLSLVLTLTPMQGIANVTPEDDPAPSSW